jgi:trigger factor
MNISFENVSEVQGLLTIQLEKADYSENVEKALKNYSKKANMPGFRPGMVPMNLIRKMYGKSVKAEEVNKLLQEKLFGYIKENKIDMLGEPLTNEEKGGSLNIDDDNLTFYFDIALSPKFEVAVSKDDTIPYYDIKITDEMVDKQVKAYAQQVGKYEQFDEYQDNDLLKGQLQELDAEGIVKEGGIVVEDATLMPLYLKNEDQKALFNGAKKGDAVVFNPKKAHNDNAVEVAALLKMNKEDVENLDSDFSYTIQEITRFVEGELTQEVFDQVFGKDTVKNLDEFRSKVAESLEKSYLPDRDYKFMLDLRSYLMEKVGKLSYADELLKRIMLANAKEGSEASVEENFEKSLTELTWHLIQEKLVEQNSIKVEDEDVLNQAREATKAQFAQYGMMNIPDELLDNYAKEMLKKRETVDGLVNRAIETKLAAAIKGQVKLKKKKVTVEEFNKLFEPATEA